MNWLRNLGALTVSIIIITIAFIYFSINLTRLSLPDELDNYKCEVMDPSYIYRNLLGVPHIVSVSEYDLFFSLGFVHAQDRLWQMDYSRRIAEGRLSEIFGRKYVNFDKYIKIIGLKKIANSLYLSISQKSKDILSAYASGVNSYIKKSRNNLPLEFGSIDYQPDLWKPQDCLLLLRLQSFQSSMSFKSDILYGQLVDKYGIEFFKQLIPKGLDSLSLLEESQFDDISQYKIKNQIPYHLPDISFACNTWSIRKHKDDKSSSAVLANDPHGKNQLPNIWYPVHLTASGFNVVGTTIPGIPLVMIGRNDYISWGIAKLNIDDADFYIEKLDKSNKFYTNSKNSLLKIEYHQDTVLIKDETPEIYYVRYIDKRPVISDFLIDTDTSDFKQSRKIAITYEWIGNFHSDEILSLYQINTAENWKRFNASLNTWGSPAYSFSYADIKGKVGLRPAGYIPKRNLNNKNMLNPAWIKGYKWKGYYNTMDIPFIFEPSRQYVYSANNKINDDIGENISSFWANNSRANRIDKMLNESIKYTRKDAQFMQFDTYSFYAEHFCRVLIPELKKYYNQYDNIEKKVLEAFEKWDFIFSSAGAGPSIFSIYLQTVFETTFADELGVDFYDRYMELGDIPSNVLLENITNRFWILFDDIRTKETENRDFVLVTAFKKTVERLTEIFDSPEVRQWRYGKINRVKLEHAFSDDDFLGPTVNLDEFETGGHSTTINMHKLNLSNNRVGESPSMRFIADMSDSLVYYVIAGGISGDPLSDHYSDQVQLWLNGGYVELKIFPNPDIDFKKVINLIPN